MTRLRRFFDVRPGEGRPLLVTFAYIALAVGSFLLAKAIRNGLFLEVYGASKLAYVYVAVPVVLALLVPAYGAVANRAGHRRMISVSLLALSATTIGFWWAFTYYPRPWMAAVFYVWVNCYGVIAPVQAWSFANAVFDTRQARRLFGLVGSGASVGAITGGLLARTLVGLLGTINLLLLLALLIASMVLVVNLGWGVRRDGRQARGPAEYSRLKAVSFASTLQTIAKSRYLRRIALLVSLVAMATQWTQFQFQAAAAERFGGNADELTRFFGDFNSAMGLVALLVQIFATGPALRTFGLGFTILLLPWALGLGVTAILLTGALWAVVLTNAFDQGLRFSVDKATFELLYLPIPAQTRVHVKTTIDLVVTRFADACGGVVLGLLTSGFATAAFVIPGAGLSLRGIAAVTLVCVLAWLAVAWSLRRGYVEAIRESIAEHRLSADSPSARILDRSATDLLAARLGASEPAEIVYALDVFRLEHRGSTHPAVRGLLTHPSAEVRQRAVALLDESGDLSATDEVEALLNDAEPAVRAEALLFLAHHADIDPLERLTSPMAFEDFSVQASLVAFLGRPSAWQNLDAARLVLERMTLADEGSPIRGRVEAARLVAQLPGDFDEELSRLLDDEHPEVVAAALSAAGRSRRVGVLPQVAARLAQPAHKEAAASALVAMGRRGACALRTLMEDTSRPREIREEIPRVLSSIGGPEARDALVGNLLEPDAVLRTQIISGLSRLHARHRQLTVDRDAIEMALAAEILGHYRSYQILGTLGMTLESTDPVARGLQHAIDQERERILRLLDPLLPDQDMKSVHTALQSDNPALRANALELLDNILAPPLRKLVIPLFDSQVTLQERVRVARQVVGADVQSPEEATLAMLVSEDTWLKACGVYAAGALRLESLRPRIEPLLSSADSLLRETTRAALQRLDMESGRAQPREAESPIEDGDAHLPATPEAFGVG
ncbi:MAG: Npt1/Npt2 family nucleotide transporter [Vicinamibacterales bacterium]